jgi:hypothetical protein
LFVIKTRFWALEGCGVLDMKRVSTLR